MRCNNTHRVRMNQTRDVFTHAHVNMNLRAEALSGGDGPIERAPAEPADGGGRAH